MSIDALASAIGGRLVANQTSGSLYDALGGLVYEGMIPEGMEALPVCRWFIVTDAPRNTLDATHIDAEFQLDLWGDSSAGSVALAQIADKAFALFHRQALTITGFNGGQSQCIDKGGVQIDEGEFRVTQRYRVVANS